jgi:hypothetical protein
LGGETKEGRREERERNREDRQWEENEDWSRSGVRHICLLLQSRIIVWAVRAIVISFCFYLLANILIEIKSQDMTVLERTIMI